MPVLKACPHGIYDRQCPDCHQRQQRIDAAKHRRQVARGTTTRTPAWRQARAYVLERDGHRCQRCGSFANTVHHLNGYSDPYNPAYLVSLCRRCHGSIDGKKAHPIQDAAWAGVGKTGG
jgi:5-methylcytosine-specific restriction endonuclease McrA